jgi:hypothetical protein
VQPNAEAIISQFDKDDVEAVGLVKFDFLGLTTLTILDWAVRYVKLLDPQSTIDLDALPLDDQKAFSLFRTGNTTAVFQFESRGMRELLKQAPVTRFEDIIALVALYRPGPMELIPDFVARKSGRERVAYADPRLEAILGPTYGVMVYQEQVMQIAQVIGGYTLGGADLLRRADAIFIDELRAADWYEKTSQAFAVFLPVKSVGVMGDGRTYDYVVALRAVETQDFMTARWAQLPYELLGRVANRIVNEVRGINRVVYDVTSKPPGTIEWE